MQQLKIHQVVSVATEIGQGVRVETWVETMALYDETTNSVLTMKARAAAHVSHDYPSFFFGFAVEPLGSQKPEVCPVLPQTILSASPPI